MGILLSLFFGFVPAFLFAWFIYWLDRYEKEPKVLLGGVFLWGALIAAGGAFLVNTLLGMGIYLFTSSQAATELTTGSMIAPVVEEILKGFAVLVVFLLFRREFDSILDGIVYAAVAALGFAATENAYYIYTYGYQEGGFAGLLGLVFVRVILVGWQHPFYTAFTGIGLAISRLNRNTLIQLSAPLIGLCMAIFTHAMHNTISGLFPNGAGLVLGTLVDWSGWFFMFLFILWATRHEQQWLALHLREEVAMGLITPAHYYTACSAWKQVSARLNALFSGRYKATARFYQVCGELAHKKQQLLGIGDESGNTAIIEDLRAELARLSPGALT